MRFKKTLITLLTAGSLLFGNPANSEEIHLTPKDNYTEIITKYCNDEIKDTFLFQAGEYNLTEQEGGPINVSQDVFRSEIFEDLRLWDMTVGFDYKIVTDAYPLIHGKFGIGDNVTLDNIIFDGWLNQIAFYIHGDNITIKNCVINDYYVGLYIDDNSYDINNLLITNNILSNNFCGAGFLQNSEKLDKLISNNHIIKSYYGILTESGYVNIGTEVKHGDNVIGMNNFNIYNVSGLSIPAKWNWFYDYNGNFLDTEEEIATTLYHSGKKSVDENKGFKLMGNIDFVPFQEQDYFTIPHEPLPTPTPNYDNLPSSNDNWEMYK